DVLAQPVTALRQRLRLTIDAADLRLAAVGKQVVMDSQPDFRADFDLWQPCEHVEGIGDPAVGRGFQRDNSVIRVPAVDFLEYRGDRADAQKLDRRTKPLDGGQVAEAILRAEVAHLENALERPRAAHQLPVNRADAVMVEWTLAGLQHALE